MFSISKLIFVSSLLCGVCTVKSDSQWQSTPTQSWWAPSTPTWPIPPAWNVQWGWSSSPPPQWTLPPTPQWNQWSFQPSSTTVDQVNTQTTQSGGSNQLDVYQQSYPPGWSNSQWAAPATTWEFHSADSWEQHGQDQWIHHLADTWEYNQETHQWDIQRHSQLWSRVQQGNSWIWIQAASNYAAGQSSSETTSHEQLPGQLSDTHSSSNQWYQNTDSSWTAVVHHG